MNIAFLRRSKSSLDVVDLQVMSPSDLHVLFSQNKQENKEFKTRAFAQLRPKIYIQFQVSVIIKMTNVPILGLDAASCIGFFCK
jgi:hypothetical protein